MYVSEEIDKHFNANSNIKRKDIMLGNFLGGLAWGVGSVIGASVVVGILGYILKAMGIFTVMGDFLGQFTR